MPTLKPAGGATYTPLLILDYSARRDTGTIVQQRASSTEASPDITLRTASLRSGVLTCLFPSAATAQAAFDGLLVGVPFAFTHEGRPQWTMTAVPTSDVDITIQEDAELFVLRLPFQEIAP